MSNIFKTGGRYGMRSGAAKFKNIEVVEDYKGRTTMMMGCGPVVVSDSFPYDSTTNTEQAVDFAKVYDESATAFRNLAVSGGGAGYSANYQMFPDIETVDDAIYFGAASKFGAMYIDMSATIQTYSNDTLTWEYFNGNAWIPFTPYDETDQTAQDGKRSFGADGYILLNVGSNWALGEVDSQEAYWVRARVTTAAISILGLTDSKEHQVTTLTNGGTITNTYGVISRGLFRFETVSASNADTKMILVNMTTGQMSAEKTLAKAVADAEVADFNLIVSRGDSIALFCTQEDGTTEFAGGTLELAIDHS
jgi:hypothetical protein